MPDISSTFSFDKVIHFVEYGILGFLLFRAIFSSGKVSARRAVLLVIFCAAVLGALDESYQSFTERDSNIYDWFADVLGATTVSVCCLALHTRIRERMEAKKGKV